MKTETVKIGQMENAIIGPIVAELETLTHEMNIAKVKYNIAMKRLWRRIREIYPEAGDREIVYSWGNDEITFVSDED